MIDIKKEISIDEVKKIFGNKENMVFYLNELGALTGKLIDIPKGSKAIEEKVVETWSYLESKSIIRNMFKNTEKYKKSKFAKESFLEMKKAWDELNLGEITWPFSAMNFDRYVQSVNNSDLTDYEKDEKIKMDSVKYRRIKEINTHRNDYLEYLIFENNQQIIPTLGHRRNVDFYINGIPYDQKVSRSVGRKFKEIYGDEYKKVAISNPSLVAKSLYSEQDEERFGCEPRMLVVYLDDEVSSERIYDIVSTIDFDNPLDFEFEYHHKKAGTKNYSTTCFIILLFEEEVDGKI